MKQENIALARKLLNANQYYINKCIIVVVVMGPQSNMQINSMKCKTIKCFTDTELLQISIQDGN